jgi:hypothetical protein
MKRIAMKRIGIRLLSLTTTLTGLAAMSHANAPDVALAACAKQVVSDFAARQGLMPKYSVALDESGAAGAPEHASIYHFTMEARDPKTGALVAHAECDAQYSGEVIAYRTLPLTTAPKTLAKSE